LCICFGYFGLPESDEVIGRPDFAEEITSSDKPVNQEVGNSSFPVGNPFFWGWSVAAFSFWLLCFLCFWVAIIFIRTHAKITAGNEQLYLSANGQFDQTGFRLHPLIVFFPIRASVKWSSPEVLDALGRVELRKGVEYLSLRRRVKFNEVKRIIIVKDLCGFFRFKFSLQSGGAVLASSVEVDVPNNLKIAQSTGEEDLPAGSPEGSFLDMRAYRPGDPIKHMLWKLWAKTNGELKFVRTPDPVGGEQLAFFLFSHLSDEANARVLKKILSVKVNHLLGVGTMNGNLRDKCISESALDSLELLQQSGSWSATNDESCSYESFLKAVKRRRIDKCWVFFPPGGEKEDALHSLLKASSIGEVNYFVSYFSDHISEKRAGEETVEFLKSSSLSVVVEHYPIDSGFADF
jgi:hypothetical protein